MKPARKLRLRSETLGELSTGELRQVVGGTHVGCTPATDNCTHGACGTGTETLAPIRSCIFPCPTDPRFTCFC
jgi:natural product precursor